MILGHFYNIKPLFSRFRELLLYIDEFRDVVQFKKSIKPRWPKKYYIEDHLHYLGSKLKDRYILSQVGGPWSYEITGRPFLFCDLSIKGDFSLYEEFRDTLEKDDDTGNGMMAHVFGMIALFVRLDLIEDFRAKDFFCGMRDTLLYLLDPSLLTQLKDNLKDGMIPLTLEDEFEFDLINNPRYHPRNRIKFLAKLAFSGKFTLWNLRMNILSEGEIYVELKELVNNLYNSFDFFCNKWQLSSYSDIKSNIEAQTSIHNDFKLVIQCIFGLCEHYIYADIKESGMDTICESPEAHGQDSLFTIDGNGKLIDIIPKNEDEVRNLVDFMINKSDGDPLWTGKEAVVRSMKHPFCDVSFQRITRGYFGGSDMLFDEVHDVVEFFCNVWRIAFLN